MFNNKLDKKINNTNTNVDKKLIILMLIKKLITLMLIKKINNTNTNDEYFIENIKDLFNNKLDKKLIIIIIIIILMMIL